jgi:hypothetical protein
MLKKLISNRYLNKLCLISNLDQTTDIPYLHAIQNKNDNESFFVSTETAVRDSYINLVSESVSESYNGAFFITEKSIRPFVLQQIPIFLGPPKIAKHFKKYGFDLFEDIIDHSYDEIDDLDLRIDLIYQELTKIQNLNFTKIFKQIKDRLHANYMVYSTMINNINTIEHKLKEWILKI